MIFSGEITTALKNLLSNLQSLKEVILTDLILERFEANRLMDHVSFSLYNKIDKIALINLTVNHCPLLQLNMFSNLKVCISYLM